MFPTFGRGERKGQAVPRWGKNFLKWRIRPIARQLGIPESLVTFQVMRRTLGTDLQEHGTLKDAQGALRHASYRASPPGQDLSGPRVNGVEDARLNRLHVDITSVLDASPVPIRSCPRQDSGG